LGYGVAREFIFIRIFIVFVRGGGDLVDAVSSGNYVRIVRASRHY
jgi:hypothetical protein